MSVELPLAKAQLRVRHADEDTLITQYISSSKAWLERYTAKALDEGEVIDTFTAFPAYFTLTRGPAVELSSIVYTDANGDEAEVEGASLIDGRVYPPVSGWPATSQNTPILVTYLAGYETTPDDLVAAQLLLIGHWYQNREAVAQGTFAEVPLAVEALAGPYRLPTVR